MLKLWRNWRDYRARQKRIHHAFAELSAATRSYQDAIVELHRVYFETLAQKGEP